MITKIDQYDCPMDETLEYCLQLEFLLELSFLVWNIESFSTFLQPKVMLKATVVWLPFGTPEFWLIVIGWWEVAIGVTFLFSRTTKIAIALLFLQMFGTFMPLVLLPEMTFQNGNILTPSLEGQYIIKNVIIISAALVLGGKYYKVKEENTL